jgi:hypothetical protein
MADGVTIAIVLVLWVVLIAVGFYVTWNNAPLEGNVVYQLLIIGIWRPGIVLGMVLLWMWSKWKDLISGKWSGFFGFGGGTQSMQPVPPPTYPGGAVAV